MSLALGFQLSGPTLLAFYFALLANLLRIPIQLLSLTTTHRRLSESPLIVVDNRWTTKYIFTFAGNVIEYLPATLTL